MKKLCSKCKTEKDSILFIKTSSYCLDCRKIYNKLWIESNRDHIKKYDFNNRKRRRERDRLLYLKNKEIIDAKRKKYYEENKTLLREKAKKYRENNRERSKKRHKKWRDENPSVRIYHSIRSSIYNLLKGKTKTSKVIDTLLGCSILEYRAYLESKFQEGMIWENYGFYGWHIDHIIPCSSFNLIDLEERKKCFHHSNTQPLWREENQAKR